MSPQTNFNAAIFYDIENLIKGYACTPQLLAALSLRDVVSRLMETGRISGIAVQRAYANWSDPRLMAMRQEINELGIDPVQVFGFGRDPRKNAADIQLAIDAVDLAHIRPNIDVFVIVSGDGGFAALARKLHEYGKAVVGAGYPGVSSRLLRGVCDDFVLIPDPEATNDTPTGDGSASDPWAREVPQVTTPMVLRMGQHIRPLASTNPAEIMAKVADVLGWFEQDRESLPVLLHRGLHLTVVSEALRMCIRDFDHAQFGFTKFGEFMQYACRGRRVQVVRLTNGSAALADRRGAIAGAQALPDLDVYAMHSADHYRSLLGTRLPIFRLPEPAEFTEVIHQLIEQPPQGLRLGELVDEAVAGLDGALSPETVKRAALCLVSAQVLERTPKNLPLMEQVLSLPEGFRNARRIRAALVDAACAKLEGMLGGEAVHAEVLAELLPGADAELAMG